jgi:uncharacterized protein YoxC
MASFVFVVVVLGLLVSRIGQGLSASSDEQKIIQGLSGMRKDIDRLSGKAEELRASLNMLQDQRLTVSPKVAEVDPKEFP